MLRVEELDFKKGGGTLPVIVQDFITSKVLMLGYVNKEVLMKILNTGYAHFWSRSRKAI